MSTTDKLAALVARCKASVSLEINDHRGWYETTAERLERLAQQECPPEIDPEVRERIVAGDSIVELQFYPDTPIGSYLVVSDTLDGALDEALGLLGIA